VRFAERTVAIVFEGIGNDVTKSGGIAYAFGRAPSGASDYEWLTDTLIKIPETITTSVDVWTGQVKTSPINVSIANVDLAARKLLYQQARTDDVVDVALSDTATSIDLSNAGLSGTVVYIGNEAIKLGTLASGVYPCTRGYWGTIAEPHAVGAFVFARNPFLLYRTYRLIVYDHTAQSEQTIQRGYISGIQTNNEGTTIEIACQELLALISRARLNRGAPKINVTGSITHDAALGGQLNDDVLFESRVWRDDSSSKATWLNVGGTIALGFLANGVWTPLLTGALAGANAPEIEFDKIDDSALSSSFSEDAYELFVIVRGLLFALSTPSSAGLGDPGAFNAVQLAYSFLRSGRAASDSGDDQWAGNWGLGLPAEYFDTAAIEALIGDSASDIVQRLILGWDGEEVEIEDLVCNKLLRPRGKFLANTQSGLITIGAIALLDIAQFAGAPVLTPIAPRLQLTIDLNGSFSAVAAEVGETPWSDPDRIVVESRTAQAQDASRRALYDTRRELVYDYSTLYAGGDNLGIQATLLSRLMAGIQAVPQVTIDVVESAGSYDLGSWYKIAAPEVHQAWWVDASGERVEFPVTPDAQFTGVLVGRKYNISSGLYTLTLLMMQFRDNSFIRWRAPSGVVASYADTGSYQITIQQNAFHAGTSDASKFSVNDYVQLFYADGEPTPGGDATPVLSITGNVIEVAATVDVPTAGMVLRLANFNIYRNGGQPVAGAGRAYVFYADATTGLIYETDAADIYG